MKTSLLLLCVCLFAELSVAAGFGKINPESFLPGDGTFAPAVITYPAARVEPVPFVRVHHLAKDASTDARKERLRLIGQKVAPAVVKVIVVVPYKIVHRPTPFPGVVISEVVKDGKKHIMGSGSGVILRSNGRVVTNAHVIEAATDIGPEAEVFVKLPNDPKLGEVSETDIPVRILSKRPGKKDLAFLQLVSGRRDWPTVPVAETPLEFMDEVIAFGYPLGMGMTPTYGMVADAHLRLPPASEMVGEVIQHSAQVNQGNSGGALVDMDGHLVGINVALRGMQIEFAIPVQDVLDAEKELDSPPIP